MKYYKFTYDNDAVVTFKVNEKILKEKDVKLMIDFFWSSDNIHEDSHLEFLLKKYALQIISISSDFNLNLEGVKSWFKEHEGYMPIDGSFGIELVDLLHHELDETLLKLTIRNKFRYYDI